MNVWILIDDDGNFIRGVYSTLERAESEQRKHAYHKTHIEIHWAY